VCLYYYVIPLALHKICHSYGTVYLICAESIIKNQPTILQIAQIVIEMIFILTAVE